VQLAAADSTERRASRPAAALSTVSSNTHRGTQHEGGRPSNKMDFICSTYSRTAPSAQAFQNVLQNATRPTNPLPPLRSTPSTLCSAATTRGEACVKMFGWEMGSVSRPMLDAPVLLRVRLWPSPTVWDRFREANKPEINLKRKSSQPAHPPALHAVFI